MHTLHLVTSDDSLAKVATDVAAELDGWKVSTVEDGLELTRELPSTGDVVLVDGVADGGRAYELMRSLTGRTRCRIFLLIAEGNDLAEPIARFCGSAGVIEVPLSAEALGKAVGGTEPARPLPQELRGPIGSGEDLPQRLLEDLEGEYQAPGLMQALVDTETGLFNHAFLAYKLDEEYKRAKRFNDPLSCLMLGFEGQAEAEVLRQLAGIFLQSSRDTDILGRFDESSFLFLLTKTGPDGAEVMARRVCEQASQMKLKDLVGDPLDLSVGIACFPDASIDRRDELFSRARDAFHSARDGAGEGVVIAP